MAPNSHQKHPDEVAEQPQCTNYISAQDFKAIKKKAGHRCLTCGAVEGRRDPRHGEDIIKLQQGRQNPERAPTTDNIMPWCQYCSQHYLDHFAFDEKGIPLTVANIEPVAQASLRVQREVLQLLRTEFK